MIQVKENSSMNNVNKGNWILFTGIKLTDVQLMNRLSRKDYVNILRRIVNYFIVHNNALEQSLWKDKSQIYQETFFSNKGKLSNLITVELEFNLHHTFRIGSSESRWQINTFQSILSGTMVFWASAMSLFIEEGTLTDLLNGRRCSISPSTAPRA